VTSQLFLAAVLLGQTSSSVPSVSEAPNPTPSLFMCTHIESGTSCVRFSPAGDLFSGGVDGKVMLHEAANIKQGRNQRVTLPQVHTGAVRQIAFSPDGTRLASVCMGGKLVIWDAATRIPDKVTIVEGGKTVNRGITTRNPLCTKDFGQPLSSVIFAPDGQSVWAAGYVSKLYSVELDGFKEETHDHQEGQAKDNITRLLFLSDGRLLTVSSHGKLYVHDRAQQKKELVYGGRPVAHEAALSPNGTLLAAAFKGESQIVMYPNDPKGIVRRLRLPTSRATRPSIVAFAPQTIPQVKGKLLAVGNGEQLTLWGADGGGACLAQREIDSHGAIMDVTFSWGGQSIATAQSNGCVGILSVNHLIHRARIAKK
jgi:WD40 repeat protein